MPLILLFFQVFQTFFSFNLSGFVRQLFWAISYVLLTLLIGFSDLAAWLCSEITPSDSQQVRNKMESLEERKLEINFRSCVVISKSEQHAKILGEISGDNSVLFSKVIRLWESRLLQIFSK